MEGALIIVIIIAVIIVLLVIGLVVWLVLRRNRDDEEMEEEEEEEEEEDDDDVPPVVGLCDSYDSVKYTKCSTLLVNGYLFRSLEFRDKTLRDKVTTRYFWNGSTNIDRNLKVGNSSNQLYTLSGNRITVNNRNEDNYLRAERRDFGWVFFGFGAVPDDEVEFLFYDGRNICFYDYYRQDTLYVLRDRDGAYVEQISTKDYYDQTKNNTYPAYIEVI